MTTKAELTKQFILETVAPIFNKYGYAATSMSQLTKATGLTKGAFYGHFESKEDIAISTFRFTVRRVLKNIAEHIEKGKTPLEKLYLISDYYRHYYEFGKQFGGCPVLNMAVDANNKNEILSNQVKKTIQKIQNHVVTIVDEAKKENQIKQSIDAVDFARRLDTMVQGAVFMAFTMNDEKYLKDVADDLDTIITNELKL